MDGMWKAIKRSVQGGAAVAITKAEELTVVGRARLDIAAAKTRLQRLHADLGVEVYRRLEAAPAGGPLPVEGEVQALREQIREAEAQLREAEFGLEEIRTETDDKSADPAGESEAGRAS